MIVRLWALAWVARYLKYVPILGWRFSESIVQSIEARMQRDVQIDRLSVTVENGAPAPEVTVDVRIRNELPVDLTVSALNVRMGYDEDGRTVVNLLWDEEGHGPPPANVSRSIVESESAGELEIERQLTDDDPGETVYVDGILTTKAWLDVPRTKRIPLGTIQRELESASVEVPSQ